MITRKQVTLFTASDGSEHKTLPEAQAASLSLLLGVGAGECVQTILANSDKIVDILTTKPSSLPKARTVNGGKKPRKHIAAQPLLPGVPPQPQPEAITTTS